MKQMIHAKLLTNVSKELEELVLRVKTLEEQQLATFNVLKDIPQCIDSDHSTNCHDTKFYLIITMLMIVILIQNYWNCRITSLELFKT